jgi:hypothetical protein
VALEVVLHRGGVQLLAIVEGHPAAQLDVERLVVCRPFVRGRKLRNDVQLFVQVEQLVAQAGENDAPDEGARARRIEDVRVLGEADAQGLTVYRRYKQEKKKGQPFHCDPPGAWKAA